MLTNYVETVKNYTERQYIKSNFMLLQILFTMYLWFIWYLSSVNQTSSLMSLRKTI